MHSIRSSILLLAGLAVIPGLDAEIRLPAILSDHMVLQQGMPVRIWGAGAAGEAVSVAFQGQSASTKAEADGKWSVWLKPLNAGGPAELTVTGTNTIVIRDVLVGEVWVGSGQSNMGFTVSQAEGTVNESFPEIRHFNVRSATAESPLDEARGSWVACTPQTAPRFSAMAYFFGREIHQARKVPVGMIQSSWGGTPAQAWTSLTALHGDPSLEFVFDNERELAANYPEASDRWDRRWAQYQEAVQKARAAGTQPPERIWAAAPAQPAVLYNAMIAPLTPYAMRGVIWYQGESDAYPRQAYPYRRLFRALIEDWRRAWGQGDFPFLFVQLANFSSDPGWPVVDDPNFPIVRESQAEALALRNTAMAVTIDIGDSKSIHPKNKREAAHRLALAAQRIAYGEEIEYSGPVFRRSTPEAGGALRVWFDHAEGLRARDGGAVQGFSLGNANHRFFPAQARIEGATVVVSSEKVPEPAYVRYAWAADPVCNLINGAGLPAGPFRTDR